MIIKSDQARGSCDCCSSATHGALAQGATGRDCEVMWLCESHAIDWAHGAENIVPAETARLQIELDGFEADF